MQEITGIAPSNPELPTGTVTFLFTDIEGSTQRWERYPSAMKVAIDRHHYLLRYHIEANRGQVFEIIGDAFCAVFSSAQDSLAAALAIQRALQAEEWPEEVAPLKVRLALYTGTGERYQHSYSSYTLNRVARFLSAGHGGQILLSQPTVDLIGDGLPATTTLRDLGEHRLKDLIQLEHVYQLVVPDLPDQFPSLKTLNPQRTNLPVQLTSFIGREKELAQIKQLLQKTRLLTLTGAGGTGKTRLSLQLAAEVLYTFRDGVWLVELAPLSEPRLVVQTVATELGIREQPGQSLPATLAGYLRDKDLLLVLDNCEHLIAACAYLAQELLQTCTKLKILATSREALAIPGEVSWRVPSLSLPDSRKLLPLEKLSQYEAIRLFVERTKAVQSSFALTDLNAPHVTRICQQLDGIPLALELAAARVKGLSVEQIAARLDQRFRLLTNGNRTALPRQQTLKALVDWSYTLLPPAEQILLARLAVFAGSWDLAAAEAIYSGEEIQEYEVLDLLLQLINKSLVVAEEETRRSPANQPDSAQTRYRMLETIRQYAQEKLQERGEAQTFKAKHCAYYLELAEKAALELSGKQQKEWLETLDETYDNLKAALNWALEEGQPERVEIAVRLGNSLEQFWELRGYLSEGCNYLERILALAGPTALPLRAKALNGAGRLFYVHGDFESARRYYRAGLALGREIGDRAETAVSLSGLGNTAHEQGDYTAARQHHEESLALRRELEDKQGIATNLNNLGNVAILQGDYAAARRYHEESLTLKRELGNKRGMAVSLNNLGTVANDQGDYATAQRYYEESLALRRELGDKRGTAMALNNLGQVANSQNDFSMAENYYQESLILFREMEDKQGIASNLNGLGNIAYDRQDYFIAQSYYRQALTLMHEIGDNQGRIYNLAGLANVFCKSGKAVNLPKAACLCGSLSRLMAETGGVLGCAEQNRYEITLQTLRAELDQTELETIFEQGRAIPVEEAIAFALAETDKGISAATLRSV